MLNIVYCFFGNIPKHLGTIYIVFILLCRNFPFVESSERDFNNMFKNTSMTLQGNSVNSSPYVISGCVQNLAGNYGSGEMACGLLLPLLTEDQQKNLMLYRNAYELPPKRSVTDRRTVQPNIPDMSVPQTSQNTMYFRESPQNPPHNVQQYNIQPPGASGGNRGVYNNDPYILPNRYVGSTVTMKSYNMHDDKSEISELGEDVLNWMLDCLDALIEKEGYESYVKRRKQGVDNLLKQDGNVGT